ncbi:phospholipase-like protein [Tanacetum coccineum]|uniref:Phospholipase-like protein n=1 Tax=Tanacetum coccineum TaxID=301880 RepID=A0ABQ5B9A7_9ASTR
MMHLNQHFANSSGEELRLSKLKCFHNWIQLRLQLEREYSFLGLMQRLVFKLSEHSFKEISLLQMRYGMAVKRIFWHLFAEESYIPQLQFDISRTLNFVRAFLLAQRIPSIFHSAHLTEDEEGSCCKRQMLKKKAVSKRSSCYSMQNVSGTDPEPCKKTRCIKLWKVTCVYCWTNPGHHEVSSTKPSSLLRVEGLEQECLKSKRGLITLADVLLFIKSQVPTVVDKISRSPSRIKDLKRVQRRLSRNQKGYKVGRKQDSTLITYRVNRQVALEEFVKDQKVTKHDSDDEEDVMKLKAIPSQDHFTRVGPVPQFMAPDHSSSGPVLHEMTSDQIRSDLTPNRQETSDKRLFVPTARVDRFVTTRVEISLLVLFLTEYYKQNTRFNLEENNNNQATRAMADSAWIEAMQDELHSSTGHKRLDPQSPKDLSGEIHVRPFDYRSKIGSLMYLTSSIPDLVQTVCYCARYQARPTQKHLKSLILPDAYDTRKCTSGGIQFLVINLKAGCKRKQTALTIVFSKGQSFLYLVTKDCYKDGKVRSKCENKGIVPTEMELVLEYTQQGASHEVSNLLKMEMEIEIPSSSNVKLITECSDTTYTCYEVMKDLIKVSKLPQTLISYSSSQDDPPVDVYRRLEKHDREMQEMKRQQAEMEDKMKKLMEGMHVGTMHQEIKDPSLLVNTMGSQQGGPTMFMTSAIPSFFEGFAPWSSPYQTTFDVGGVLPNAMNRERRVVRLSMYCQSPYINLSDTTVAPKKRPDKTKNKARNGKAPAFDIGNVYMLIHAGGDHWVTSVINLTCSRFYVLDSLASEGRKASIYAHIRQWTRILNGILEEQGHFERTGRQPYNFQYFYNQGFHFQTPQQANLLDCGVVTCFIIYKLSVGQEPIVVGGETQCFFNNLERKWFISSIVVVVRILPTVDMIS